MLLKYIIQISFVIVYIISELHVTLIATYYKNLNQLKLTTIIVHTYKIRLR